MPVDKDGAETAAEREVRRGVAPPDGQRSCWGRLGLSGSFSLGGRGRFKLSNTEGRGLLAMACSPWLGEVGQHIHPAPPRSADIGQFQKAAEVWG